MDGFDLDTARLIRLQQDIDALLPYADPQTRQTIFHFLSIGVRQGLDLFPMFRDQTQRLTKWQPSALPAESDNAGPANGSGLEMEVLRAPHRATLWPYRPKRLPDELLSSWLWRIARGLGAPPKRFAFDAIGVHLTDIDRDIGDRDIARLAFLSGQSEEHLLRGTMRADVPMRSSDRRESIQQALLQHGDLVLNRSRRGRSTPIIQYCPVCLAGDSTAYLRRGWRFSFEVVCWADGCFLLDSCWRCGALLDPLSQTVPSTDFRCVKCSAPLARAPSLRMTETIADQLMVYSELDRLAFVYSRDFIGVLGEDYINTLSSGALRGTNPTNPADRHNAVMLEACRIREAVARSRAAVRAVRGKARAKQRKTATASAAAVSQATASAS